jgi:hypothetical protein
VTGKTESPTLKLSKLALNVLPFAVQKTQTTHITNNNTDTNNTHTSSSSNDNSSSSNNDPPLIDKNPGYWESENAVHLFRPAPGDFAKETLEKQVGTLKAVRDDWEVCGEIVKYRVDEISIKHLQRMLTKSFVLGLAYEIAMKKHLDKLNITWTN